MRGTEGTCPGCDARGTVGESCDERGCKKRGLHFIADSYWERLHQDHTGGPDPIVGQKVGDFLVVDLIGAGGFGKVYLAYQAPLLRLKGALKLINISTEDPEFSQVLLKKFQSEAEVLAHLTHPNIVRLLKYGLHNSRPYLVMEFVDKGRTLREEIFRRTRHSRGFSADELIDIFNQVLNGLGAAHEESIIHRDIKPENLMLQSVVGNPHHTRLLDFGLAKFVEHRSDTRWHLGSPNYMAPEQISRKNLGPWTDLYAVTVMLFELLTGRRPFPGKTDEQVMVQKIQDDYEPLAEIADLDLPDVVTDFLATGLTRDPEERFRDVESMREAMVPAVESMADRLGNQGVSLDAMTARLGSEDILPVDTSDELPAQKPVDLMAGTKKVEDAQLPPDAAADLSPTRKVSDDEIPSETSSPEPDNEPEPEPDNEPETETETETEPELEPEPEPDNEPEPENENENNRGLRRPLLIAGVFAIALAAAVGAYFGVDEPAEFVAGLFAADTTVDEQPDEPVGADTVADDDEPTPRDTGVDEPDVSDHDAEDPDVLQQQPDEVSPLAGMTVRDLSLGKFHTCILLDGGDVRCWGKNSEGELGIGSGERIGDTEPAEDAGVVELDEPAVAIDVAGDYNASFSCAILESGALRCWGSNHAGQLGLGTSTRRVGRDDVPADVDPLDVGGAVVQVATGAMQYATHACALLDDGAVRCWGDNRYGQLGLGREVRRIGDTETPAHLDPVDTGGEVIQIETGKFHTCAVYDNGDLRCWGRNNVGQLGYGHTDDMGLEEVPADLDPVDLGGEVQQVSLGRLHTCALLEEGRVRCWGWNQFGQLGLGHTDNVGDDNTPAEAGDVDVGADVVEVLAGGIHTCALVEGGAVRCWGDSRFGQLGYGNRNSVGEDNTPADLHNIHLGGEVLALDVGNYHNCAVLEDDTLRCWGMNEFGQLGYGHTDHIGASESPASAGPVPAY